MTVSLSGAKPFALIVEDNEAVAEICQVALERAEFEVEVAPDGQIALDRLANVTPALILLDLHLPNVSGQQVLQYIRTNEHLAGVQVILTSADIPRAKDLQYEVDFVLEKPFSFFTLCELAKALRLCQTINEVPAC